MTQYKNKIAVITGAASGIGKALAVKCLEHKMKVVLVDLDENKLQHNISELNSNDNILLFAGNVAKETDMIELAKQTINKFGAVNFLFNNAGIAGSLSPIWMQAIEDIEQVLQVNLMGTIHGIKTFVPLMLEQNDDCFIINTCAGAGLLTGAGLSAYKASKHAIMAISEVLFADLKQLNSKINVSVLIPHWVNTNMPKSIKTDDLELINTHIEHLKAFGMTPESVAEKVFTGIREKQFYIFTHFDEHAPKIKKRMESILNLQDPS